MFHGDVSGWSVGGERLTIDESADYPRSRLSRYLKNLQSASWSLESYHTCAHERNRCVGAGSGGQKTEVRSSACPRERMAGVPREKGGAETGDAFLVSDEGRAFYRLSSPFSTMPLSRVL